MNTKMWLAPVLAVLLALLLAGAMSPFLPQNQSKSVPVTPIPSGTPAPQASAADTSSVIVFFMSAVAIVLVGVAIVFLFFREKNLNKD